MEESLPNIKGDTNGGSYGSMRSGNPYSPSASGCFIGYLSRGLNGENTNYGMHVSFDASRSSSTYQDNASVRPLSESTLLCIRY